MAEGDEELLVLSREFPPRILGGLSYHLGNLYSSVVRKGYDVTVLAGTCEQTTVDESVPTPDDITIDWIPFSSRRGHHLRYPLALYRHLRGFDLSPFDAIVTHTPIPFGFEVPTIGKYHDGRPKEREFRTEEMLNSVKLIDTVVEPTRRWVERRSMAAIDAAIFNSELNRRAWRQYYDLPDRSVVHYNGVDTNRFYPRDVDDGDYLLFVGSAERKGVSRVLEYASESAYPIKIAGGTSVEIDGVTTLGRVSQSELPRLYSGALATIHPANFEAFGNVILESLACGTPVVTTETTGASEILDGQCGVVTDDLNGGVETILDGSYSSADCVATARQYSWDSVADRMLRLVHSLV